MKYCKKCGLELEDEMMFCPKCGSSLDEGIKEEKKEDKKTRVGLILGSVSLGIATLFGYSLIGFFNIGALALGIVGLTESKKNEDSAGKGLSIAGIVVSCIAVVYMLIKMIMNGGPILY